MQILPALVDADDLSPQKQCMMQKVAPPSDFLISPVPPETWELRAVRPSAEPAEHYYHPGGLHPVHLNEVYEQRYRIIRKLGYGSHSTVWLALDDRKNQYVALKFFAALPTQLFHAKDLMGTLQASPCAGTEDSLVCPSVYDHFIVSGPNGMHPVTVMETLGQNLKEILHLRDVTAEKTGQHLDLRSKGSFIVRSAYDASATAEKIRYSTYRQMS
ncbi:hypothetical protein BDZ85DRAFT_316089 [Elsinoe ampelina]|uniref:non-specific serine/threonine protein kinase n=1 Tax=Elsinoe ampelina TaxID=302913 RepID=A0A6A6GLS2_9PEZI|nr:hypothetical protein BDZ85DRAFT_316089 [Elsinoe ampelina]